MEPAQNDNLIETLLMLIDQHKPFADEGKKILMKAVLEQMPEEVLKKMHEAYLQQSMRNLQFKLSTE